MPLLAASAVAFLLYLPWIPQLLRTTATVEGEVIAAHTRNRPVVTVAESLIRHDYYMAEIFAGFGAQIDEAFGPHLRDLRLACFSPDQVSSFKERTGLV